MVTFSFSNQIYNTPSSLGVCEYIFIVLLKSRKDVKQWYGEMTRDDNATCCFVFFKSGWLSRHVDSQGNKRERELIFVAI